MIHVDKQLIPDVFYVAVSGGVDSIAAAHLLHRMGHDFTICHFNHNLRDKNDEMEMGVKKFAKHFNIPFVSDIRKKEELGKGSEEAILRESRMAFFDQLESTVLLCQHLDDAVEGYVMNMLRGTPEHVPIPRMTYLENSIICRPFLSTRKECFSGYAERNDLIKFIVEDETNLDNRYRRNWIRNEILPQFKPFGLPKIVRKKFYL